METRKIMIANTKTQKRYTIETAATTLGELMDQMSLQGIDYEGMSFTEGISRTHLLSRDSMLPTNVNYKGVPTNNLVMLLTNTQKNIASGAGNRREAYNIIKAKGAVFANNIKETYGRNYTQVPTSDLWDFIDDNLDNEAQEDVDGCVPEKNTEFHTEPKNSEMACWVYDNIKFLANHALLTYTDVAAISELTDELAKRMKESAFNISEEDIEAIIIANL